MKKLPETNLLQMSKKQNKIKSISFKRAEAIIGLTNLVYNMFRKIQLQAVFTG